MPRYAVVDIFAGPGGLAEGFSSVLSKDGNRAFSIALSVEKDKAAHSTLQLRSFLRQFG
ncbi:DNA (cytosine-5-)-methyltransferase, partial [Pseudomonas sp. FW306-02-F08-AA]